MVCPLGRVTTAFVASGERSTAREALWPLGPVTVLATWPSPRTVWRLMLRPPGPVVVDDTADIKLAAKRIVASKSFDNSILCTNLFAADGNTSSESP